MADSASPNPVAADDALGSIALLDSEQRKTVRLCLSVLGALGTASLIGVAFSLYLVNHYPLLLIALSPLGRHMVLVAPMVDPIAFVVVAVARRMGFYLASFHLGRTLGPAGTPGSRRVRYASAATCAGSSGSSRARPTPSSS